MIDDGLPLVVVLPGNAFGRWDKPYGTTRGIFRKYLQGDMPMIPSDWAFPFEHAEDTARSHIRAMQHGEPGEEYIIADDARTISDILQQAETVTGVSAPRTVSSTLFSVFASGMRLVERLTTPPEGFESETLAFLSEKQLHVDNSKAKRELGIEHRPLTDGLEQYLEWEQEQTT
jgi:nucleoside-diphosphate-sugar epimerase